MYCDKCGESRYYIPTMGCYICNKEKEREEKEEPSLVLSYAYKDRNQDTEKVKEVTLLFATQEDLDTFLQQVATEDYADNAICDIGRALCGKPRFCNLVGGPLVDFEDGSK